MAQRVASLRTRHILDHVKPSAAYSSMSESGPVKVAILDDYLDLSTKHFKHIDPSKASVTVFRDTLPAFNHEATTKEDQLALIDRLKPFSVLASMRERTRFPRELLESLPNLKVLLATGTQFETFDLAAARELGIQVATSKGRGRSDRPNEPPAKLDPMKGGNHPTVQHTWALILALASNVAKDDAVIKSGGWQSDTTISMNGKTLGVIGLGRLGAAAARIGAFAFGMKVVTWSQNLTQEKADKMAAEMGLSVENADGEKTFQAISKEELFKTADVVAIHYVLSERSYGLVGEKELGLMKKTALLVNTSRGPLIDEAALLSALEKGSIRGAGLDVFDIEPVPANSPWRSSNWGTDGRSKVVVTPHMGYVEEGTMNRWYSEQAENLERWIDGKDLLNKIN